LASIETTNERPPDRHARDLFFRRFVDFDDAREKTPFEAPMRSRPLGRAMLEVDPRRM
jgi:hypothetical protein